MTLMNRCIGALLALCLAQSAHAAQQGVFDVTLLGVRAATLSFAGQIEGQHYTASGQVQTTGLANLISQVSYWAEVRGRFRAGRFEPRLYRESARDGDTQYAAEMRYRGRVPQPKGYAPPRAASGGLDPATQAGTVDIMTAVFSVLRDQPREAVCSGSTQLFDGARRSEVVLGEARAQSNGEILCGGEYRRLQGFSAKAMAERQRFPFTMTYAPLGDGTYRVMRVDTQTTFGRASLRRRAP